MISLTGAGPRMVDSTTPTPQHPSLQEPPADAPLMLQRPLSLALALAPLLVASPPAAAQTIVKNTRQAGFVALPGSNFTAGLWAFEGSNGRQYCLQTHLNNGLYVIDTTDTSAPTVVSTVLGYYRKVAVYQDHAYATADSVPTWVIDLSDPTQATAVNSLAAGAHTLRVDETNGRLYLNRSSSMQVYDLTQDPAAPQLLGTWTGPTHDCRPAGDLVYVNGSGGTRILDLSDPGSPVQLAAIPDGNHSSDVYHAPSGETYLLTCDEFTGGHLNVWNVTDPAQPSWVSKYQTPTNGSTSVHNVEVKGAYAYLGYYLDQLRILDLSNPNDPAEVGVWDNNPENTGVWWDDAWDAIPDHDAVYMNQQLDTPAGPKGLYTLDFFPAFGTASAGAGGVEPEIWWSFGPPSPGNADFGMRLSNAAPDSFAFLLIGASRTSWGPVSLPYALGAIDAPNALLQVSPDLWVGAATDSDGEALLSLPLSASLPNVTLYAQWIVKDPGAPNPGGWAVTKGGELVLQ